MEVASSSSAAGARRGAAWPWAVGLAAALALGGLLRLVWVEDIEFKADEEWTFRRTQEVLRGRPIPWLGMPSSAGPLNPGLSVWVFVAMARLTGCEEPTALARGVQGLGIAALLCLPLFAFALVGAREREAWLWAAVLAAVNPTAVLLERKIWPPSVLPLCTLLMLAGWWRRERWWGAFLWGGVGACLGQVHMSGFFFAAGFALWAALFDRRRVAWTGWLLGSGLAALPLLPWLAYLVSEYRGPPGGAPWVHLLEMKFWVRWAKQPLGFGLEYALRDDYAEFLSYPLFRGRPTYLVWLAEQALLAVGVVLSARLILRLWRGRRQWPVLLSGKESPTAFTLGAAFWGFGLLLTVSGVYVQRHYLEVASPLAFVWLARLALPSAGGRPALGRGLLLTLCLAQALLTASFLDYIHSHHGSRNGDYGPTLDSSASASVLSEGSTP
jgi:hypothetical protein